MDVAHLKPPVKVSIREDSGVMIKDSPCARIANVRRISAMRMKTCVREREWWRCVVQPPKRNRRVQGSGGEAPVCKDEM